MKRHTVTGEAHPEQLLTRGLAYGVLVLAVAYTAHLYAAAWTAHLPYEDTWRLLARGCALLFAGQLALFGAWSCHVLNRVIGRLRRHGSRVFSGEREAGLRQALLASAASLIAGLVVLFNVLARPGGW